MPKRILKAVLKRIYWLSQRALFSLGISVLFLDPINFKSLRVSRITPHEDLFQTLLKLQPINNGVDLIRIGAKGDGGYLASADLLGISHCISVGCDKNCIFERDLEKEFGIHSHIINSQNRRTIDLPPEYSYAPKWIGTKKSKSTVTLDELIS